MSRLRHVAVCVVGAGLSLSCAATIVRSGLPASQVPEGYEDRWESSWFWGTLAPAAGDLSTICPDGWSEIRAEAHAPTALLGWLTLGIYTPSNLTITCAAKDGAIAAPPGEEPLHFRGR